MLVLKAFGIPLTTLLAVTLMACDPGATITYVNETNQPVDIYLGHSMKAFDSTIPAHSETKVGTIRQVWRDIVVVRDQQGTVLSEQEMTWNELKAQHFRVVIANTATLATPTSVPSGS